MRTDKQKTADVFKVIRNMIEFPQPTICRHAVAAELLSMVESWGVNVSEGLAGAVVDADDETALRLLPK